MASKIAENTKIAIRNIRRDGIEKVKKLEKDKEIGQDDSKKYDRLEHVCRVICGGMGIEREMFCGPVIIRI